MTVTAPDNDGYCDVSADAINDVSADAINDAVEEFNITIVARRHFTHNTISQQTVEIMKVTARSTLSPFCLFTVFLIQSINQSINQEF